MDRSAPVPGPVPGGERAPRDQDHSSQGRGARCPGGPALIVVSGSPQWGSGCGQCLPGATEPLAPRPGALRARPRRAGRIAPGILESFQFLPTSGGSQEAGVQVTLRGCRDFPETKKRRDEPPSSSSPKGKGAALVPSSGPRGQGSSSRLQPRGPTPRDPAARLSPTNWLRTRRATCPGRVMPTGQPGASDPRAKASQARAALLTSRRSLCSAQPRASRGREDAPAGQELLTPDFTSRHSHPARGAVRSLPGAQGLPRTLDPQEPTARAAYLRSSGPGASRPSAFLLLLLLLRLRRSSRLPRPSSESLILPGSRFNPGGGVRVPRVTPPSAGAGSPRAGGGTDRNGCPGRGWSGRGRQEEEFLPGKARDALSAGPRGSPGTLSSPAGLLGLGRSASPSPLPLDRAGRRRFAPEHPSLDSGGRFWGVLTESRMTPPSPGAGDPLGLCALGEDPGVCSQGPLARTLEPKTQPSSPRTLPSPLGRLFSALRSQLPPPPSERPQEWPEVFPPT